jgi:hypothetical protein
MTGRTDRRIARLIAEAMGSVRTLYDREKGIGEIPSNLRESYGIGLESQVAINNRAPESARSLMEIHS